MTGTDPYDFADISPSLLERCCEDNREVKESGQFKRWDILQGGQGPRVEIDGHELIMLASNNYLNLVQAPEARQAAIDAIEKYGVGMAAGRTLCGTNALHEELEAKLAHLSHTDAALLYHSCYSANVGVISTLAGKGDLVFSDALNHASIIDGCRMSRAEVNVYPHADMDALEQLLVEHRDHDGLKMIVTDGVFSFDGDIVPLPDLMSLARKYDAFVVCDEAHAAGVIGPNGRGTAEFFGLEGKVDVITGTLGKALGGTVGGYVASNREVIDYLIRRSRSFIFTNALPPAVVAANSAALDLLESDPSIVRRLQDNAAFFRHALVDAGFNVLGGDTPVIPVFIGDSDLTVAMGNRLFDEGVFAPGFGYPVTPRGQARIRTIICSQHTHEDLETAAATFRRVGKELGII